MGVYIIYCIRRRAVAPGRSTAAVSQWSRSCLREQNLYLHSLEDCLLHRMLLACDVQELDHARTEVFAGRLRPQRRHFPTVSTTASAATAGAYDIVQEA